VLVRAADRRSPSGRVVIVDVDERSLSALGQWPWRRDVVGQLMARLQGLGASVVALDIIFAEPDRLTGSVTDPDAALAESLRVGRVVLGYGLTFDGARDGAEPCVRHPLGLSIVEPASVHVEQPFFKATNAVCNLPQLTAATHASGFLNAAPDSDGILRRVPLLAGFAGRVYPSLALAAVAGATANPGPAAAAESTAAAVAVADAPASTAAVAVAASVVSPTAGVADVALHVAHANASTLFVGSHAVPLDGKGNMLVRFRGVKRTFQYVSAVDVLHGRAPAESVRGKVVFVGTSALGTREVVATPLDTLFTGVEVQATVADNLLQRDANWRPAHAVAIETAGVLGLGLAMLLVVWRFGLPWGGLASAACLAIVWALAARLLSDDGLFVSPVFPTLGVLTGLVGMVIAGFTTERVRADRAGEANDTSRRLMVQTLLSLTGIRDAETGQHSRRTQRYTRVLAQQLSTHPAYRHYLTPDRVDLLASLAPLHDIGKVGVPDRVLNKPGELTADERAEMQRHPVYGRDVIANAERAAGVHDDLTLAIAKDIVYTHHEKWDGSGYPEGLRGAEIPIPGRIMALVDVYDAVHTRRLYQTPRSHADTIALLVKGSGTHFDPVVVEAFVAVADTMRALSEDEDEDGVSLAQSSSDGLD
jgi:CHASE2 domain-containing sensor protein